ncbi:MAG: SgcJ/EcaC family oxidoreductase [Pseudomonadota bacterium]
MAMDSKTDLEKAADQFFTALNALFDGDPGPMTELWSHADDIVYMGPSGRTLIGWDAIRQDWEAQAAMRLGGEIHLTERHVTIGQDLAVAHHVAQATNRGQDGNPTTFSDRGTNVFRKEDGRWRLIAHHSDPLTHVR